MNPESGLKRQRSPRRDLVSIRRLALLSLVLVTPLGFWLKTTSGPGQSWANNHAVGALYVVFWCLALFFVWPRRACIARIAISVLVITCVLEVLQLWHPWALEQVRRSFLGRTLIGTAFDWWDFPHYALGCLLGWLWMHTLVTLGRA